MTKTNDPSQPMTHQDDLIENKLKQIIKPNFFINMMLKDKIRKKSN